MRRDNRSRAGDARKDQETQGIRKDRKESQEQGRQGAQHHMGSDQRGMKEGRAASEKRRDSDSNNKDQ